MVEHVVIILFLCTTQVLALRMDYLDPILHQEHIQSPNGHYKYGYESNSAIAQQIHSPDGTSKGFYSYVDDQGKIQRVEYIAGNQGYKVLSNSAVSSLTPEVAAATKAHMEAYLAVQKRVLEDHRTVFNRVHEDTLKNQRNNLNAIIDHHQPEADINLFSGQPLQLQNHFNAIAFTTPKPTHMESKQFILPPPIVHHYEKTWHLPPLKFKDLYIKVNGQNRYDPRTQYNYWIRNYYPKNLASAISKPTFQKPSQFYQAFTSSPPIMPDSKSPQGVPIPEVSSLNREVVFQKSHPESLMDPKLNTTVTAHQVDLLRYTKKFTLDPRVPDDVDETLNKALNEREVAKIVVTKSNVNTKSPKSQSDVQKAFKNALNVLKQRHNLS